MKKYQYLASWDDQTLTRVGEPVVVRGDSNVSQVEVTLPSNFLLDPTKAECRMYFLLPGEKESDFETLETAVKDENGYSHVTWTIKHVHSQKGGRLTFSLTLIGDDAQWDSRTAIIPVYESRYQPESEEAEEPYTGRLDALEGTMASIRGEFAEVQEDFEDLKESRGMVSTTWAELKALRDNGQLVPGQTYRITDYICTTTQEGSRVESHPYDIIVTADSETTLSEIARACVHDAASAEYYQYAHIEAWELKYSLDNNARRFAWADGENGRGVVYYLKDDHGNECPYDFKQIQFARYKITACTVNSLVGKYAALQHGKAITGIDEQNPVWCYTFSYDSESTGVMSDASVMEFNANNNVDVSRNIIKPIYSYQDSDEGAGLRIASLNCIVFIGNVCQSNTFGNNCSFNTFGNGCSTNTFGNYCQSNTFGNGCSTNTFGDNCSTNTFGNYCSTNTFGNGCSTNTFGNNCFSNTFGDYCQSNTFGNYCQSNTFGDYCSYIDVLTGTSSQKQKRYYNVLDGVQGTNRSHISITGTDGNNFVTYVGKNSSGKLKTWVPADLVR